MMPIMSSSVKCLLQGLDIMVDVSKPSNFNYPFYKSAIFSLSYLKSFFYSIFSGFNFSIAPIDQTYFKYFFIIFHFFRNIFDCLSSTYEESGIIQGFCKGVGALILSSFVKYLVVKMFKTSLNFYNQQLLKNQLLESQSQNFSHLTNF